MRNVAHCCFLLLVSSLIAGCGSDEKGFEIPCNDDELYDQVADTCVPRARQSTNNGGNNVNNVNNANNANNQNNSNNSNNTNNTNNMNDNCDRDNDGARAISCGGNDCDDGSIYRSPNNFELCDDIDNDCSGEVNDGIDCTFYAHSGQELYQIDPFAKQITEVGTDLPNLQDIDTHPDGTLYGVTFDGLYHFDEQSSNWMQVGEFGIDVGDPNGMAIDLEGTIFVTSETNVYTIDAQDGSATLLGSMDGEFYSSGDCVVNKYDTLFMTSKHDETQDHLITINRADGKGTQIGPIGFRKVFALTSAWGFLYGLTDTGQLITIDVNTGNGELVHTFEGYRFFGAASTPDR